MNSDPAGFAGGMNWFAHSSGDLINQFDRLGLGPADSERYTWVDGSIRERSRAAHCQEANEALLQSMKGSTEIATRMGDLGIDIERTATGLAPRQPPAGWTWHHAPEEGVMQLVPRAQHAPGSIFQPTLHPGGKGGMAIWGE